MVYILTVNNLTVETAFVSKCDKEELYQTEALTPE